jgi:hypothetical protein
MGALNGCYNGLVFLLAAVCLTTWAYIASIVMTPVLLPCVRPALDGDAGNLLLMGDASDKIKECDVIRSKISDAAAHNSMTEAY